MTDSSSATVPATVRSVEQLWFLSLLLYGIIAVFDLNPASRVIAEQGLREVLVVGAFIASSALTSWIVLCATRKGRRWARWLLIGIGATNSIVQTMISMNGGLPFAFEALSWIAALMQAGAAALLLTTSARVWSKAQIGMANVQHVVQPAYSPPPTAARPIEDNVAPPPSPPVASAFIVCPHCKEHTARDSMFCSRCGGSLTQLSFIHSNRFEALSNLVWPVIFIGFIAWIIVEHGSEIPSLWSKPSLRVSYDKERLITVLNVKPQEILVTGITVNGSKLPACSINESKRLSEGQSVTYYSFALMFGSCGRIVRVTVRTDRGEQNFHFDD